MKSKKIIASIAAVSVLAMSSLSFAAITIKDSTIGTLSVEKEDLTIKAEGSTSIETIVAKTDAIKNSLELIKSESVSVPEVTVEQPAEKQKCETLLYKQIA